MLYRINLSPDEDVLDGRNLDQLIRLWLDSCRTHLPALTVDGYGYKIAYFLEWWQDVGRWKNWELSRSGLREFAAWLDHTQTHRKKPLSYNTKKDILRRLRQCLHWACDRGHTGGIDFSRLVPKPTMPGEVTLRVPAQRDDLQLLLDAAAGSPFPERDQALLALFIQTGIRRGEAASLRVENIAIKADLSGTMLVTGKRTKARPTGQRVVAFDSLAGAFLARYLATLGAQAGPVFLAVGRVPLSAQGVYKVVKRLVAAAGLADVIVGPHDLRRAFITDWRRRNRGAGFDHLLRLQVGHANDAISDIYDLAGIDDLSEVIAGPLSS